MKVFLLTAAFSALLLVGTILLVAFLAFMNHLFGGWFMIPLMVISISIAVYNIYIAVKTYN